MMVKSNDWEDGLYRAVIADIGRCIIALTSQGLSLRD